MGWTIRHRVIDYEVIAPFHAQKRGSSLLADGVEVDSATAKYWESSTLTHGEAEFKVTWGPLDKVKSCRLIETLPDPEDPDGTRKEMTPLDPPAGSHAAGVEAFRRKHPALHASRRNAVAALQVTATILGLGLLFTQLLPRINWSWLPDISRPEWLRPPDWLRLPDWFDIPDIAWPAWLVDAVE